MPTHADLINLNPGEAVMAGEALPRTLAAQANVLWPQERLLIERYRLPARPRILDAGCGTGEVSERWPKILSRASILGVDVLESLLTLARRRFDNWQGSAGLIRFWLSIQSVMSSGWHRSAALGSGVAADATPGVCLMSRRCTPDRHQMSACCWSRTIRWLPAPAPSRSR
jgi:SAM-dependent methyltransferase